MYAFYDTSLLKSILILPVLTVAYYSFSFACVFLIIIVTLFVPPFAFSPFSSSSFLYFCLCRHSIIRQPEYLVVCFHPLGRTKAKRSGQVQSNILSYYPVALQMYCLCKSSHRPTPKLPYAIKTVKQWPFILKASTTTFLPPGTVFTCFSLSATPPLLGGGLKPWLLFPKTSRTCTLRV